jgi:hypothetical protein
VPRRAREGAIVSAARAAVLWPVLGVVATGGGAGAARSRAAAVPIDHIVALFLGAFDLGQAPRASVSLPARQG